MKTLRLALIGFGNAGKAFAKLLADKQEELKDTFRCQVIVTAIVTATKGTLINENGICLGKACRDIELLGHFDENSVGFCKKSALEVIKTAEYDVMCELTPLNILTGQPAIEHIQETFKRGRHVITANKGPIAWAYDSLSRQAKEAGVMFFYETTVMDGTPVFNLAEKTLRFCKITEITGILNSTTNYVLEELAKGEAYNKIIEEGKKRGFIEADESMDIDGYDAAAKLAALVNVLMGAKITPFDVEREGIRHITYEQIHSAEEKNKTIKLICRASKENGYFRTSVKPELIDKTDMLASIDSTTSVLTLKTDLMGKLSVIEHAPEIEQTAYGIFSDVVRILENL